MDWSSGWRRSVGTALSTNWKRPSAGTALRLAALVVVLGIVVAVFVLKDLLDLDQVGYPAIAALSFFASAGMVIPVPGMASVCAGGWQLNSLTVALVAGTAGTVGELTGYMLGYSGSGIAGKGRIYQRIEGWMKRRGWLVIFMLSVLPNPIFDLAGISAGVLRYPVKLFLAWIWIGTFLKFLMVAYACAFSVDFVMGFFGVDV